MSDKKEITFKTKTGYCHILPDKIILTRDGIIGNVAKVYVGNNIARILLIYSVITLAPFYMAFDNYKNNQLLPSLLCAFGGVLLIYVIISSINNSSTSVIDRQKIKKVNFKRAVFALTRSRFEVFFEDENGRIKKRLILLSGMLSEGQNETEKALEIMKTEKLITNR